MTVILAVPGLVGRLVRLEPLTEAHTDDLVAAAGEDRSTYGFTTVPQGRETTIRYVRDLLTARSTGEAIAFAQVRVEDGRTVGATRFLSLRSRPGAHLPYAVEIGGTWLAGSAQGTGLNTEAKLLLLTHAFESWNVGRVDFKTDARNARSRAAILAIGARFEGILGNWQPSHVPGEEHELRDSAIYAVLDRDWPGLRRTLAGRLHREPRGRPSG
jgi:RimJ/RimL family protein N-acetyltransferase